MKSRNSRRGLIGTEPRKIRGGLFVTETAKQIECLKKFLKEFYRKYDIHIKDYEKKKYYNDVPYEKSEFEMAEDIYLKTSKNFYAKLTNRFRTTKINTDIETKRNKYLGFVKKIISIYLKIQKGNLMNTTKYQEYLAKLSSLDKLINKIIESNNEGKNYDMFYDLFCTKEEMNKNIDLIFELYFEYSYISINKEKDTVKTLNSITNDVSITSIGDVSVKELAEFAKFDEVYGTPLF